MNFLLLTVGRERAASSHTISPMNKTAGPTACRWCDNILSQFTYFLQQEQHLHVMQFHANKKSKGKDCAAEQDVYVIHASEVRLTAFTFSKSACSMIHVLMHAHTCLPVWERWLQIWQKGLTFRWWGMRNRWPTHILQSRHFSCARGVRYRQLLRQGIRTRQQQSVDIYM